ncbi:MAG: hypothetical protein ABI216_07505 [Devosia sp.]
MKILCVNWQASDDADLELQHYLDIEVILARSSVDTAARLDPEVANTVDAVINYSPVDLDHPLFKAWRDGEAWIKDRLVVTPHAAFFSPASMVDLRLKSIEVVHAFLSSGRLTNCVNSEYLKR